MQRQGGGRKPAGNFSAVFARGLAAKFTSQLPKHCELRKATKHRRTDSAEVPVCSSLSEAPAPHRLTHTELRVTRASPASCLAFPKWRKPQQCTPRSRSFMRARKLKSRDPPKHPRILEPRKSTLNLHPTLNRSRLTQEARNMVKKFPGLGLRGCFRVYAGS